ncbi:hypothetical protein C8F04DRAFT_1270010 [Mycena alexandri]|uniref:Nuclear condensin complex subunit 3 C-terminal domain-containing protein n=1 Tax=Mycena alexandri TaxID=1745969 RepID=A0AAD6WV92_9AGAR|nr:hypothetical protein C8F04DRAFT_1270010 [Mycena alexandri]
MRQRAHYHLMLAPANAAIAQRAVGVPIGLPSRLRRAIQAASTCFAHKAYIPRLSPAVGEDPDAMYSPPLARRSRSVALAGLADDPKILKTLLLAYVSPRTAGTADLQQCLSYFFLCVLLPIFLVPASKYRFRHCALPALLVWYRHDARFYLKHPPCAYVAHLLCMCL